MTNGHFTRSAASLAFFTGTALLAAGAAQAAYSVQTSANTGRGYLRGCAATYNAAGTGALFINNDGGGSTCNPAAYASYQTVTVSGTTDTTGTLPAAHDESSVVAGSDAAYATAAADLATGQVHLTASATGFSSATSYARLRDTLHFTIAGANADTVTLIPVSFAFDGTMPGTSDPMTAFAELTYGFYFGNASTYEFGDYAAGYYGYYGTAPVFAYAGDPRVGGWASYSFASYDPLDTQFTGCYAITGATADIALDFGLGLNATNVALDYAHTGSVSIGTVAGVSYTSDSGVFLSRAPQAGGAVPEPASWVMFILGFGLTGAAVRRRHGLRRATA